MSTLGFHLSEIGPLSVCITGFKTEPNVEELTVILNEFTTVAHVRTTKTKEENAFKNVYVYIDFEPETWNMEVLEKIVTAMKTFQKENETLLVVHRYSQVDQLFFGSLHPNINEKILLENINFGNVVHIEIKRRKNQTTNYGFATVLDSKKEIEKLIEKRYFVVQGVRVEFKPKTNKKDASAGAASNITSTTGKKQAPRLHEMVPRGRKIPTFVPRESVVQPEYNISANDPPSYYSGYDRHAPSSYDTYEASYYDEYEYERELYYKYLARRNLRKRLEEQVYQQGSVFNSNHRDHSYYQ